MPPRPALPEPEPGFLVVRDAGGADRLCWRPTSPELVALLSSFPPLAASRWVEQAILGCGLESALAACGCTDHLHQDSFGTCSCGHTCVWHFEDGAQAPCRGLHPAGG